MCDNCNLEINFFFNQSINQKALTFFITIFTQYRVEKGNIFFAKFYVDSKHCGAIGTFCTSCTVYRTQEAKHMYLASCPNIVITCAYEH